MFASSCQYEISCRLPLVAIHTLIFGLFALKYFKIGKKSFAMIGSPVVPLNTTDLRFAIVCVEIELQMSSYNNSSLFNPFISFPCENLAHCGQRALHLFANSNSIDSSSLDLNI